MTKVNRREAIGILLLGLGSVGGCSHLRVHPNVDFPPPADPSIPQACVWLPLSYSWNCLDWKQFEALRKLEMEDGMTPAFRVDAP